MLMYKLIETMSWRKEMRCLAIILSLLRDEFDKFNNTGVRLLESIYHNLYVKNYL